LQAALDCVLVCVCAIFWLAVVIVIPHRFNIFRFPAFKSDGGEAFDGGDAYDVAYTIYAFNLKMKRVWIFAMVSLFLWVTSLVISAIFVCCRDFLASPKAVLAEGMEKETIADRSKQEKIESHV